MSHIPEDETNDEFMNASAEEWSKPSQTPPSPAEGTEPTDRWGSPLPVEQKAADADRWGSDPADPSGTNYQQPKKAKLSKGWIIAIIVLVVLCLCVCAALAGLIIAGVNLFQSNPLQF